MHIYVYTAPLDLWHGSPRMGLREKAGPECRSQPFPPQFTLCREEHPPTVKTKLLQMSRDLTAQGKLRELSRQNWRAT